MKGVWAMQPLGKHYLIEVSGCAPHVLDDMEKIKTIMLEAALKANAEVKEAIFHRFSPFGISGVVVISESHVAIHTWPEYGYAAVDIYTCGQEAEPLKALEYIIEKFGGKIVISILNRGIPSGRGSYTHSGSFGLEELEDIIDV